MMSAARQWKLAKGRDFSDQVIDSQTFSHHCTSVYVRLTAIQIVSGNNWVFKQNNYLVLKYLWNLWSIQASLFSQIKLSSS
jgi:hypothetical protein